MRSIWEKLLCQVGDLVLSSSLLYPGGIATLKDCSKDLESSSQGKSWGNSLSFSTRVGWRRELPQMSFLLFLTSVFTRIWIALDILQFRAAFLFFYVLVSRSYCLCYSSLRHFTTSDNHWEGGSYLSAAGIRTLSLTHCRKPTGNKILHSDCCVRWCVHNLLVFIFTSESFPQIFLFLFLSNSSGLVHHHLLRQLMQWHSNWFHYFYICPPFILYLHASI